jgi:hypothetical protein
MSSIIEIRIIGVAIFSILLSIVVFEIRTPKLII